MGKFPVNKIFFFFFFFSLAFGHNIFYFVPIFYRCIGEYSSWTPTSSRLANKLPVCVSLSNNNCNQALIAYNYFVPTYVLGSCISINNMYFQNENYKAMFILKTLIHLKYVEPHFVFQQLAGDDNIY
jgi:hypothetical protein